MLLKFELRLSSVLLIVLKIIRAVHGVVGGNIELVISVPWIVSLSTKQTGPFCGGVLLENDTVLTTAFCLSNGIKPHDIIVRLGSDYANGGGETSTVEVVLIHPKFNAATKDYNFALLKMSRSFSKSQVISTIKLKATTEPLFVGKSCLIAGYGWTSPDGGWQADYRLRTAKVSIINKDFCAQRLQPSVITETMLCAGTPLREGCVGDAGGPLTCDGQLAGIISWSKGCALGESIGVYADPSTVKSWFREEGMPI